MFFFFGILPIDQSKIKHTKQLKEIPSRHDIENLLENLKLIGNLQGFCQYIMGHSGENGNAAKLVGKMSKSVMWLISIHF